MNEEDMPYIAPAFHRIPSPLPPPSPDPSETHGPLEFRMNHRLIVATIVKRIDPLRTVYRLKIEKPSILDYIPIPIPFIRFVFQKFFDFFPYLKTFYSEWFLPSTVILKKRKPDWNEEFENEKLIYRRLQPLQGRFIPYFYGEAIYDDLPALVLSGVIGQTLDDLTMKHGEDEEFGRKLEEVYKALSMYGVTHEDPKLDNAIDVGDRIMIFDFEQCTIEEVNWEGSINKGSARYLLRRLQTNRQCEDEEKQREEKRREEKRREAKRRN